MIVLKETTTIIIALSNRHEGLNHEGVGVKTGRNGLKQGRLTLILKGEVSIWLTSLSLLVGNQLFQEKVGIF